MSRRESSSEMSAVGKRLWRFVQDRRPRYTQTALAEDLTETGLYTISSQSVSNYLRRDYPPVPFLNATAKFLGLSEAEKEELRRVYFQQDSDALLNNENIEKIAETEQDWDRLDEEEQNKAEG
jgi:hypothetical protein